ncbi:MAG: CCA tRNA nucleotidyltransferase, partial [Pseudomonadota bacterium]
AETGKTRMVGGAVRDGLLGLPVSDIDFATEFTPDEVMRRLEMVGLKAIPTGLAHGTVTAISGDFKVEVTTLRHDVETDGRHAEVAFTDDWRADAARRDFTINALNATLPGGVVGDYFGGLDDLAAGRVRFIGDALERIAEDHLRILRFFRFQARFGRGAADPDALAACKARARDLMALSRERISGELLKLLALPAPADTMQLMIANGIWRPVIPAFTDDSVADLRRTVAREAACGIAGDAIRRLGAMLPADPEIADGVAARLRLSRVQKRRLAVIAGRNSLSANLRGVAFRHSSDAAVDLALITTDMPPVDVVALRDWTVPTLPIGGGDLIAMGVERGPKVSMVLQALEQAWIKAGFPGDAERVDQLAAAAIAKYGR